MTDQEIRLRWTGPGPENSEIQRQMWDRAAQDYSARAIPEPGSDSFLQKVSRLLSSAPGGKVLDIGCGAGLYTIAASRLCGGCTGVDISPQMVSSARRRAEELGAAKAAFLCLDWAAADIDRLGFRGAFDLVFARMTPAVCDYATFDKMNACSRRWCIMEKHTRRSDRILDQALAAAGIKSGASFDDGLVYSLAYLWNRGYCPQISYRQAVSHMQKRREDMSAWCISRARLRREISQKEEEAIRAVVSSCSPGGVAEETITSTIVTLSWEV